MEAITRYGVTPRWSDLVVHRGIAYVVVVPDEPSVSPTEQFVQLFRQVDERLAQAGSSKERMLQVLIYLPFPEDLVLFNTIWEAWVPLGHAPSRACVHVPLAAPGYRAELVITAACEE
ncbi:MAG: RidA family protein [Planctomycetota bacterium]